MSLDKFIPSRDKLIGMTADALSWCVSKQLRTLTISLLIVDITLSTRAEAACTRAFRYFSLILGSKS